MNLTLRQLRLFTTTAELASVSRAAASLHVTQPALTRALHDFESQLGAALFRRSGRGIALTHEGERFLPVARRLRAEMERAVEGVREQAKGLSGSVTLALGSAFGCAVLPAVLKAFARTHPAVRARLVFDDSTGIVRRIAHSEADLGIGSPIGDTDAVACELLLRAPIGLLGDARRFQLRTPLTAAAIRALPLLKDPPGTSILHALRSRGLAMLARTEAGVEVSSLPVQVALAHAGVGVAVVSALGASHPGAAGLRFVPLQPKVEREIYLMQHSGRDLSPPARSLAQALRDGVRDAPLHPLVKRAGAR